LRRRRIMGSIASKIQDNQCETPEAPRPRRCALLIRVTATREAGDVRRCHIVPHHGQYNVAQHSYGAMSLLLLLHPNPSLDLIKAVQWHDCAERWLGDIPAPAKWTSSELGRVYEQAEEKVLKVLGLLPSLGREETNWLKAVDTLDLWLWCREEEAMGNETVSAMRRACETVTETRDLEGSLPEPVRMFYAAAKAYPHRRLSDFFEEVEHGLGEAGA